MKKRFFIFIMWFLFLALSIGIFPQQMLASQVVIVDLGGITFEDIEELNLKNIADTIKTGASGLVNTNTGASRIAVNAFLTLGSGELTSYGGLQGKAYLESEEVDDGEAASTKFKRLTGKDVKKGNIVVLDLPEAKNKVEKNEKWGILGSVARENNIKTALIGNMDFLNEKRRTPALMLMDKDGIIDRGFFEEVLVAEAEGPLTQRSNYEKILEIFNNIKDDTGLIYIEPGDLWRLDTIYQTLTPEVYENSFKRYALLLDSFVGELKKELPEDSTLFLFSPVPSKESIKKKELMSPLVIWSHNTKESLVTSETTKREGIVSNIDILPTIFKYLEVAPPKTTGKEISFIPEKNTLNFLIDLNENLIFTYNARPPLVKGYIFTQIVIITISLLILLLKPNKRFNMKPILLGVMSGPLALLLVVILPQYNLIYSIIFSLIIVAILVLIALALEKKLNIDSFLTIAFLTSFALALDVFFGSNLIKVSTLGYDPMVGARYYGIGNEFMGVIIGASIITSGLLLQKYEEKRKKFLPLIIGYFVIIAFLLGSPNHGINVGGTITAIITYIFLILLYFNVKIKLKHLLYIGIGTGLVITFVAMISISGLVNGNHLGDFFALILAGNFEEVLGIIIRKINMNIKLIRFTIWSRVFLLGLIALAIIFYKPVAMVKKLKEKLPYFTSSIVGILTGSIIVIIFNDSGIVAAATMMIYGVAPLIEEAFSFYLKN